jgi:hypothetical protein
MATIAVKDATGTTQTVQTPAAPGQSNMANSKPVAIASDQSAVPVSGAIAISAGGTTATVKPASTAPVVADPALVVTISPNCQNPNGPATMANSSPVTMASDQSNLPTVAGGSQYKAVAASTSGSQLGSTGAIGDYLEGIVCVVATPATSQVQVQDGAGALIIVLPNAVGAGVGTYYVPLGLKATGAGWKVTTAAGVSIVATGKFT